MYVLETTTKKYHTQRTRQEEIPEPSTHMIGSNESRKEATDTKTVYIVLNAKTKTRLVFWNVGSMFETGHFAHVTAEMRRYSLHVLGIYES